jgi:CheY-like chemotaxis protein
MGAEHAAVTLERPEPSSRSSRRCRSEIIGACCSRSGEGSGGLSVRALVVDDDEPFRALVAAMLSSEDAVVEQAADGDVAVRLAADLRPDVVLMDISMPRMNGIDAAKAMRATNPSLLIIFLSGTETEAKLAKAANGGSHLVIRKSDPDLASALRDALGSASRDQDEPSG